MILACLLLILGAVILLVLGLANGSSLLLVGSIGASLLAAIALVVGARQAAAARAGGHGYRDRVDDGRNGTGFDGGSVNGDPFDGDRFSGDRFDGDSFGDDSFDGGAFDNDPHQHRGAVYSGMSRTGTSPQGPPYSGMPPAGAPHLGVPPSGRPVLPEQRSGEARSATAEAMTESIPAVTPAMMSGMAGLDPGHPGADHPDAGHPGMERPGVEHGDLDQVGMDHRDVAPNGAVHDYAEHDRSDRSGEDRPGPDGRLHGDEIDDEVDDDDPPDEPAPQVVLPGDAARVARMSTEVLVIDGRPRYHLPGCVHLLGRESESLPVGEAVGLGFTPCSLCEPDSALLADARRA